MRVVIVALDQKPVLALLARLAPHPDQMPTALQFLTMKLELEVALLEAPMWIADRRPRPLVPDDDRAAAVFAFGDCALEVAIFERVVLDRDRQTFFARHQARAARDRPALEHPVQREAEIVVEPRRVMLLHNEEVTVRNRRRALRLGGRREVALLAIGFERHGSGRLAPRRGGLGCRRGAPAGLIPGPGFAVAAAGGAGCGLVVRPLRGVDGCLFPARPRASAPPRFSGNPSSVFSAPISTS